MFDEEGNIWITYNGEIYNFQEIRNELIENGYTFKSHTDTEVVINAHKEWGYFKDSMACLPLGLQLEIFNNDVAENIIEGTLNHAVGRTFVRLHYVNSPQIAKFISGQESLLVVVRWSLLPLVGMSWSILRF